MLNNSQFLLKKRAAGPATSTTPVTATTKKVTVVAPIIGTSQQGKSTLIKFLHEYANQPIDASANLVIGNGLTSATQNVRRYSLRIPRREVLLRRANNNNNTKSSRWTAAATADKETQLRARRIDRMERRNINDMLREVMARETTPVEVEAEQEHDEDLFARAADMYEEGDSLEVLKAKLESLRLANKEEMLRRNLKRESSFTASSSSSLRTNTKADNEVLRLAKETLAMDAQEAEVEGRETDAKSLYELLAELELESEATTTKKTTSSSSATKFENISRFGMNKNTATCATKTDADLFGLNSTGSSRFSSSSGNKNGMFKSERCEFMLNGHDNELGFEEDEQEECFESLADKIEDLLEDRTLELEMTQVRVEDEPRLILDVIDTPGLLDSASLVDPMTDLEHLALTLDKVRESKGNTSTLVYVINANRPLDASNLTILKTYLSTLGDFTRNLVVVHSGFDFRRALRRTDSFGAKLNLFDLGPRASEFDRHLATTLGFPHIRAIHVPMNNDLAATMPLSPMRAGLRAMSFQAVNHFIDVLEQLAVEVPAPLLTEATMLTTKLPVMPLMRPMTMNMDVTEIVKTKLVRDIDLLAESLVTKKIDMLRNEALLARRVRDAEQLVLREQLARSDAELAAVEYAMSKLDTEDLIEFHTKTGHWTTTTTTTTSGDLLGNEWTTTTLTQDASPYIWRVGASGLTTPLRRGLFANLHLLATPPTPLFAKISIASAEFPIRSVREILPSGMPVAIRHRAVNPTTFELVLTAPMLMSVTSMSTPVIAKLFTFRKDMYAKELLALRERRTHLRAHMAMVRTRLTVNAAEEALERQMQAMYRVLEALRGDRMPLDLLLATKDLYRGVSRVLVGEVQQVHQVRVVPNMMRLEAFKSVLDNKPVVVRDLDALVGKMEKFFLGF